MSKIEDVFLQEQLTEIEPVGPDDKIMATLSEKKTAEWNEIVQLNAQGISKTQEFVRQEKELQKLQKLFDSKRFLFWHAVENSDERFESVQQRGKTLAVKKDSDGKLVVVEFELPKQKIGGIFIMPPPEDD